jgi:pimeloyl-ACP methyl ester carboxylesterase
MASRRFALPSGRGIGVSAIGDALSGRLVVFFHPTPGAGVFDPNPLVTNRWGVHLVMLDRPGMGASDPLPDSRPRHGTSTEESAEDTQTAPPPTADSLATVQARADDVAEFLMRSALVPLGVRDRGDRNEGDRNGGDSRGSGNSDRRAEHGTVGVVGWSSGGAVALSLAARHPELVDRVAIAGTPAPFRMDLGGSAREALELLPEPSRTTIPRLSEELARPGGSLSLASLSSRTALGSPSLSLSLATLGIDPDDPALAVPGLRSRLQTMLTASTVQGTIGIATDLIAARDRSWADALGRITAPTLLVYGGRDGVADQNDGRWFRRRIGPARLVSVPDAGHLVLASAWTRILDHVAPNHGGLPESARMGAARETGDARESGAERETGAARETDAMRETGTARETGDARETGAAREADAIGESGKNR